MDEESLAKQNHKASTILHHVAKAPSLLSGHLPLMVSNKLHTLRGPHGKKNIKHAIRAAKKSLGRTTEIAWHIRIAGGYIVHTKLAQLQNRTILVRPS